MRPLELLPPLGTSIGGRVGSELLELLPDGAEGAGGVRRSGIVPVPAVGGEAGAEGAAGAFKGGGSGMPLSMGRPSRSTGRKASGAVAIGPPGAGGAGIEATPPCAGSPGIDGGAVAGGTMGMLGSGPGATPVVWKPREGAKESSIVGSPSGRRRCGSR